MTKKILIFFVLFFSFLGIVNGAGEKEAYQNALDTRDAYENAINNANSIEDQAQLSREALDNDVYNNIDKTRADYANSADSNDDLTSEGFVINVFSIFPGGRNGVDSSGGAETVKSVILIAIDKLMIGIGVIGLLIMLIGAGYIIIYHGQDNLLSKGKTIFMAGIIALIVALSSQIMVRLVEYLIYS